MGSHNKNIINLKYNNRSEQQTKMNDNLIENSLNCYNVFIKRVGYKICFHPDEQNALLLTLKYI